MKLPAEPPPIIAIQDPREQIPLDLGLRVEVATLTTGDYSIKGLTELVSVERKSSSDMLGCIGGERERFDREVIRLLAYPHRLLVVESAWRFWERGEFGRSQVSPKAARSSLLGWQAKGLPVLFVDDHAAAGRAVANFLTIVAKRRWRELRAMLEGMEVAPVEEPAA